MLRHWLGCSSRVSNSWASSVGLEWSLQTTKSTTGESKHNPLELCARTRTSSSALFVREPTLIDCNTPRATCVPGAARMHDSRVQGPSSRTWLDARNRGALSPVHAACVGTAPLRWGLHMLSRLTRCKDTGQLCNAKEPHRTYSDRNGCGYRQ